MQNNVIDNMADSDGEGFVSGSQTPGNLLPHSVTPNEQPRLGLNLITFLKYPASRCGHFFVEASCPVLGSANVDHLQRCEVCASVPILRPPFAQKSFLLTT